ncbi:MAG TPA: helix-turn-helix transcriptional regulator [Aeromicrobium sp.]|nr:helix-turn-helix transcriptional regulator [Aeromicrobium sp.]HKY58333.1 helix-turn-helix transcriptional regulator [Aeromicrobium sp.]
MPVNRATAGEALRVMREAQGLTLRQLASLADVNHAYLSQVERGLKEAHPRWMQAVKNALADNLRGVA